jgi:hypothetical protein
MQNQPSNAEQALPPEQAAAKAAILAECEPLTDMKGEHLAYASK